MNNKKIFVIQENKNPIISAINAYLDYTSSLYERFFTEEGVLKEGLPHDEKAENLILSSKENDTVFEKIRQKIKNDDFNLSAVELDYISLALLFVEIRFERQINLLSRARDEARRIKEVLWEGTNLKDTSEKTKVIDILNKL